MEADPGMTPLAQAATTMYESEYKIAADRYENIYKAIWQNFSYMAALSAGILTFGSKSLTPSLAVMLATVPLLFWFYATYLPMDHYARSARRRAAAIEGAWSDQVLGADNVNVERPTTDPIPMRPNNTPRATVVFLVIAGAMAMTGGYLWVGDRISGGVWVLLSMLLTVVAMFLRWGNVADEHARIPGDPRRMRHFSDFGRDDPSIHWRKTPLTGYFHVNQVVIPCFLALTSVCLASGTLALRRLIRGGELVRPATNGEVVQMKAISSRLADLQGEVNAMRSELGAVTRETATQLDSSRRAVPITFHAVKHDSARSN